MVQSAARQSKQSFFISSDSGPPRSDVEGEYDNLQDRPGRSSPSRCRRQCCSSRNHPDLPLWLGGRGATRGVLVVVLLWWRCCCCGCCGGGVVSVVCGVCCCFGQLFQNAKE